MCAQKIGFDTSLIAIKQVLFRGLPQRTAERLASPSAAKKTMEAMPPDVHPPETGVKIATSEPGSRGVEAATYS